MKNVLVAMSGGVDSSVAAALVREAGYGAVGCSMRLFEKDARDAEDARAVCERLGMPFHLFSLENAFRKNVIESFVKSYLEGVTPNPCIICNRGMKFGTLLEKAAELGCEKLATGHYARVARNEESGLYELRKGADPGKDQSYVLYMLTQDALSRVLFPLGDLTKDEVRKEAGKRGFVTAAKKESQDICFIPDGDHGKFIEHYSGKPSAEGDFVDASGKVLGRHKGICRYTVGQRRGLGIAAEHSLYVTAIRPETNEIVLGAEDDVFSVSLTAGDVSWTLNAPPSETFRCRAKIRYRKKEEPATVDITDDRRVLVTFDKPQRAITPGQSVVFYDGDLVLGGGIIEKS